MATASAAGHTAESVNGGAICPLARKLMAAGMPEQPWRALRDGKPVLSGRSLRWMAEHSCVETAGAPKYIRYRPHPRAE